jgi:hypothetical protein
MKGKRTNHSMGIQNAFLLVEDAGAGDCFHLCPFTFYP